MKKQIFAAILCQAAALQGILTAMHLTQQLKTYGPGMRLGMTAPVPWL